MGAANSSGLFARMQERVFAPPKKCVQGLLQQLVVGLTPTTPGLIPGAGWVRRVASFIQPLVVATVENGSARTRKSRTMSVAAQTSISLRPQQSLQQRQPRSRFCQTERTAPRSVGLLLATPAASQTTRSKTGLIRVSPGRTIRMRNGSA